MDHLLLPPGHSLSPRLQVPFLSQQYVAGHFKEYGKQYGCNDIEGLLQLHEVSKTDFLSLLQTWLYFGLLQEFFGHEVDSNDFISLATDLGKRINSSELIRYGAVWANELREMGEENIVRMIDDAVQTLGFTKGIVDELDSFFDDRQVQESLLLLSIKLLVEFLYILIKYGLSHKRCYFVANLAARITYSKYTWRSAAMAFSRLENLDLPELPDLKPLPSRYLVSSMLGDGWCQRKLASLSYSCFSGTLFYLWCMNDLATSKEKHVQCTEMSCVIDNLQGYEVQHNPECMQNNCSLVRAPIRDLIAAYKGDIPVLRCTLNGSGNIDIGVLPGSKCPGYTAISHVWSDGLGNDVENAIPYCQLLRLTNCVAAVQSSLQDETDESIGLPSVKVVYFWLDTLCIPVAEELKPIRNLAISRIDMTFEAADAVLSLDRGLQRLSIDGKNSVELAAHLFNSKWPSRCWTLPEQQLAHKLYVQFKNRAVSARELDRLLGGFLQGRRTESHLMSFVNRGGNYDALPLEIESTLIELDAQDANPDDALLNVDEQRLTVGSLNRMDSTIRILLRHLRKEIILEFMGRYVHYSAEPTFTETSGILNQIDPFAHSGYGPDFPTHWNAMVVRSTSKPQDGVAIFGLIMDLAIEDIIQLPKAERMKAVLNALPWLPSGLLFSCVERLADEGKNAWVPTQVSSGPLPLSEYTLETYSDGRMIGPLRADNFRMYSFIIDEPCGSFRLKAENGKLFEIKMLDYQAHLEVASEWLIAFPSSFKGDGFVKSVSCTAACFTITQKRRSNWLVRWVCVVDVKCLMLPEHRGMRILEAERVAPKIDIYVECDMTRWPSPRYRRSWLAPDQNKVLVQIAFAYLFLPQWVWLHRVKVLLSIFFAGLIAAVGYLLYNRGWKAPAASGILIPLCLIWAGVLTAPCSWARNRKSRQRGVPGSRAQRVLTGRIKPESYFSNRIRRWVSLDNSQSERAVSDIPEAERSAEHNTTLATLHSLASQSSCLQLTNIVLRVGQILLAFATFVVAAYLDNRLSPTQSIDLLGIWPILAFAIINLAFIPFAWAGASRWAIVPNPHVRRATSLNLEFLVILLWLIGFALAVQIVPDRGNVDFRDGELAVRRDFLGAGVALAALLGFDIVLALAALKGRAVYHVRHRKWRKSPVTLNDLFAKRKRNYKRSRIVYEVGRL